MNDKKVYILMATYNGEKYIREQIDSILNQTYKNWKLIIHDDNSKDRTVEIIKEYVKKYPDKILLIDDNIATGGAKENFTYILENIDDNFDYIMFSDQDDVWLENKIELTLNKMMEIENVYPNKPILVHTDLKVVDEKLGLIAESMFEYQKLTLSNKNNVKFLALENIITGCTVMINKCVYKLYLHYNKNNMIMHDWFLALIVLLNDGIIETIVKPTILYRQHSNNDTGAKKININYYFKKIFFVNKILKTYNKLYLQSNSLGIKLNLFELISIKLYLILRKFI